MKDTKNPFQKELESIKKQLGNQGDSIKIGKYHGVGGIQDTGIDFPYSSRPPGVKPWNTKVNYLKNVE